MKQGQSLPGALLWDMDGLLVDSEPLWTIAETETCARLGGIFTPAAKAAMVGHRLDGAVEILLEHLRDQGVTNTSAAELSAGLLHRMVDLFSTDMPFLPGALDLLAECKSQSIPCVLVSSSYRALIAAVLAQTPPGSFAASIGGDEVAHAKPHPEPYLRAAAMVGLAAEDCLVLEDSPTGMRSAIAAGCQAVIVPSVPGIEMDPTWRVLDSLEQLSLGSFAPPRS